MNDLEPFLARQKSTSEMDAVKKQIKPDETPEAVIAEMRESAAFNAQRFDRFPSEYRVWCNGEIVVARKAVAERLAGFADRFERALVRERAKARRKLEFMLENGAHNA